MIKAKFFMTITGLASILFCFLVGGVQLAKHTASGFFPWRKANAAYGDKIRDVKGWNRSHGLSWLLYGTVIGTSYLTGQLFDEIFMMLLPLLSGILGGAFAMAYHHRYLILKYAMSEEK